MQTAPAKEHIKQVRFLALNLLARREHSSKELKQKLVLKGFDESLIDACLLDLAHQNLQSDQRFAESFLRQRIAKYYGPIRIRYELHQKGVASHLINTTLQAPINWFDIAQKSYKKRFSSDFYDDISDAELKRLKARQFRYLQSRGFEIEQIQCVINS